MIDITLKAGEGYFGCRVGAIIICNDQLLMVKNNNFPYYYSVGGRIQFGETLESAVLREVYEETNIHFEIDRLAFIHQNFFVADFMEAVPYHEIAFFYLMKQNEAIKNMKCDSHGADGGKEFLNWLPLSDLSNYQLFPPFFKTELQDLKQEVAHFITKDGETFRAK